MVALLVMDSPVRRGLHARMGSAHKPETLYRWIQMRDPDPHTIHFHVLDPVLQILNYCALRIQEFALLCQRRTAAAAAQQQHGSASDARAAGSRRKHAGMRMRMQRCANWMTTTNSMKYATRLLMKHSADSQCTSPKVPISVSISAPQTS